jgi:predicted  nucleic acid-binding Zn-ribbon protein
MFRITLTVLAATLMLGGVAQGPALGQNAAAAGKKSEADAGPPGHRYRFSHTAEGVLRLDNETGEVVLCRALNGGWVCNPAAQESDLLKVELKRKDEEVKKLTAAVAALKAEVSRTQGASAADRKSLQDEVAGLQSTIAGLKSDMASLTGTVSATGKQQGITQDERQGIVSRLGLLEQDNSGLKGALTRLETDNAALKKQVAEAPQVTQAPDLEPAVTQAIAASEALKRDLAAANDRIAKLEKQVADDSARRELNAAVAQARDANDALKRELAATKDQLAALQTRVADPTDRNAQRAEIDRLTDENKVLTDKLASLQASNALMQNELDALKPPPPLPKAEVPSDGKDDLKLPSREDMERAKAALGDAWRKLMDMIGQMQKDMLGGKNEPPVRL